MTRMDAQVDILIVGGGMVGASLAFSLRHLPWSVGLVDPRNPNEVPLNATPTLAADFHPRVSALSLSSAQFLTDIGIWPTLSEQRIGTYQRMRVWDAEGTAELDFNPEVIQQNALGHIVENRYIEQQLWQALATSKIHCFTETRAIRAERHTHPNPAWWVDLDNGSQLSCQLLLIADGARSPLRDQLQFQQRRWSYEQTAVVANVEHTQTHQATAWQAFHRSGALAFLPLALPHASAIVWSLDRSAADAFLAASPSAQARSLAAGIGHRLGAVDLATSVYSFPLQQQHCIDYIQPGVAVLGDAAHSIHPLAGQGVNIGLLDVAAMAKALQEAAQQQWSLDEFLILRRYQRQRQGHNLATMLAMEGLKRLFGRHEPAVHLLRNAGMRAFANNPMLLKAAVKMASGF